VRELRPGLWHWTAPHPDWQPSSWWPRDVSSYALDDGSRLILFDPQSLPEALLALAAARDPVIVLTAPWHERDTRSLVERLGAPVYGPPPDSAADLMQKFGVTAEQAGTGSSDLAWLTTGELREWHPYAAGDRLPFGAEAFLGREHNDLLLWIESQRAVISGDTLVDFGDGFDINSHLRGGVTREQVADRLRPLLSLPVELVLSAHGAPQDRAVLERLLARP
jgi:hypothetical protein